MGWEERRKRIDEVGSIWPVAEDISLASITLDGLQAEWSLAPSNDATRVLMFFHGGGYCSGSILSHRRMVTEAGRAAGARTLIGWREKILFPRRSRTRWHPGTGCEVKISRPIISLLAETARAAG